MENKELFLEKMSCINPNKFSIKVTKNIDYFHKFNTGETLKFETSISIISGDFSAVISSRDTGSFSIYETTDVFESKGYSIQYDGLFKEAYSILKPLLIVEV